jgi:hypothetical protein
MDVAVVTGTRSQAFFFMALGFALWMLALSVLYGAQGTMCELGWQRIELGPISLLRLVLAAIWVAHIAVLVWLYVRCYRVLTGGERHVPLDRFLWRSAAALAVAAIAATVWICMAVWVPSMCPPHYA